MIGPWIHALWERGRKLSDIEYLSIKEFDGKLVKNEGFLSATGTLATLTASGGKDMYIARAKIVGYQIGGETGFGVKVKVELQINGTAVETGIIAQIGNTATGVGMQTMDYEFKNIGHKVAATQVIKLEVTTLSANHDVEGFIECFEETTGASPAIS